MGPIEWKALIDEPEDPVLYWIDPYLPRESVILLYGKTSVGKSPLTWHMARCIATGEPFFGFPVARGRVLYLEVDSPKRIVRKRLAQLEPPPTGVWFEFLSPFNVLETNPTVQRLATIGRELQPDVVFVNTLRKVYEGEDVRSDIPTRVYGRFQRLFSGATLVFVHHDRKSSGDPGRNPDEDFSGHAAWLNDAQVGLHVVGTGNNTLSLGHTKSQISETVEPLHFTLEDGAVLTETSLIPGRVAELWPTLPETLSKRARVKLAATTLEVSERSVWRALASGVFQRVSTRATHHSA